MLRSYFKTAIRSLIRSKGYSVINITGLAVGMAVTMMIGMWVHDEISFNTYHENYARIAQVYQQQIINGEITTISATPVPLGEELKTTYGNDFERVVRSWWQSSHILSIGENKIASNGTFMDPEGLEMFSIKMVNGSEQSLRDLSSIVISESTAKALFPDQDPIGKTIQIDNSIDVKVTGVYQEIPYNSHFHSLDFISNWDLWVARNDWMKESEHNWNSGINTYVELKATSTFEEVTNTIKDIRYDHLPEDQARTGQPQLFLHPMKHWHLYSEWENGVATSGRVQYVWLFGAIGFFVLLLACINFMNLSTAQSQRRAREVGIRKSIGSIRRQLIYQFLTESFLVVCVAFVLSICLVTATLPLFNELADKRIHFLWTNPYFWMLSLGFILITSFLSGSYPALYLSSFQPIKVLKGTFKAGRLAAIPRRVLVVIQFTISISLIVGTIIVWEQIQFAKNRPVGYDREGLIMIRKTSPDFWGKYEVLRHSLLSSGSAAQVAESSSPATEVWFTEEGFHWSGKDPNQQDNFAVVDVTHDYGKTMGWKFIEGRDFSREYSTDTSALILNATAARMMNLENPVGEEITRDGKRYTVIGVIEDMIMGSPYEPVKQTIFALHYEGNVWINVRLNPDLSAHESLTRIESVFKSLFPAVPFDYTFIADEFRTKFAGEVRIGKLSTLFAALSIFISCLGLFGMASFVAEQRRKEIGVRKILGASVWSLWRMLSTEFLLLVGIACAVGIPIAAYFLMKWLSRFEYHTEISPLVLMMTVAGSLIITLFTVSVQTIRASIVNPVESLKSE